MNIFDFRHRLIDDYAGYTRSFIQIRDQQIREYVGSQLEAGVLWPDPLIQLNPSSEPGSTIDQLVADGLLHPECSRAFRIKPGPASAGQPLQLHRHQTEAVLIARGGHPYVLTTGTGSGKSMAYIVPAVDFVVKRGSRRGIQAIVVYPMNALANSQRGELRKFLCHGYPDGNGLVTFERYTGQESAEEPERILAQPPDILLTNYVIHAGADPHPAPRTAPHPGGAGTSIPGTRRIAYVSRATRRIPARRTRQREEYLSRPRFLAISEFGPRAIVYHEGSRYLINREILPIRDDELLTTEAKQCDQCGYLHPIFASAGPDLCDRPGAHYPRRFGPCCVCRTSPPSDGTRLTATRRSGSGSATISALASDWPSTVGSRSKQRLRSHSASKSWPD